MQFHNLWTTKFWVVFFQCNHPNEKDLNGSDALFPCSDDPWSLAEEEALLDAVEHHGFGSWFVVLCILWRI
jgi:hypothetical protein